MIKEFLYEKDNFKFVLYLVDNYTFGNEQVEQQVLNIIFFYLKFSSVQKHKSKVSDFNNS